MVNLDHKYFNKERRIAIICHNPKIKSLQTKMSVDTAEMPTELEEAVVTIGSRVILEDPDGNKHPFNLFQGTPEDDEQYIFPTHEELPLSTSLAQQLLGKRAGDTLSGDCYGWKIVSVLPPITICIS